MGILLEVVFSFELLLEGLHTSCHNGLSFSCIQNLIFSGTQQGMVLFCF